MGDLLGAGIVFLLGWLMQNKGAGPAPRTPRDVPWPQEGKRALTKEEKAAIQQAASPFMAPMPETLADKARAAAKSAFSPSPLSDVSEYRKATRPGGRVIAPDMPKSDWREPAPDKSASAASEMLHALDAAEPGKA